MLRPSFVLVCVVLGAFFALSLAAESPLVSVIIPTYGRSAFLLKSIELIKRQDYPNLEVVIVDDSEEPELNLPKESWIHYFHLGSRVSIGEKRNIAVNHAKGVVIVHWDDDDYFREHRISAQVAPILSGEADMTVLEHHYYFHLPSKSFFTVKRASSWGPHFATFVYRRAIFEAGVRYPDNSMAEDYAFAEFALNQGYSIKVLNNEDGKHIYMRHRNTWEFDFKDYDAQIKQVPKPDFFSERDYDFYTSIKLNTATGKAPKLFTSPLVKWNRRELHPAVSGVGYPPYYPPYYPKYKKDDDDDGLSTGAKIGIGVGVAGGVVLIVGVGIAAYFFFQWRKGNGYERINNDV